MAHQRLAELHKTDGDAAFVHQLACQHEERDRHQRKAVHAVIDIPVEQRDVFFLPVQPKKQAGRGQQAKEHRQSDQQEQQEQRKEPNQHLFAPRRHFAQIKIWQFRPAPKERDNATQDQFHIDTEQKDDPNQK